MFGVDKSGKCATGEPRFDRKRNGRRSPRRAGRRADLVKPARKARPEVRNRSRAQGAVPLLQLQLFVLHLFNVIATIHPTSNNYIAPSFSSAAVRARQFVTGDLPLERPCGTHLGDHLSHATFLAPPDERPLRALAACSTLVLTPFDHTLLYNNDADVLYHQRPAEPH
jgi:hypothetical protein